MEQREQRYRQLAEGELDRGEPRDPVLEESIQAAAEKDSSVKEEYTSRRADQMLTDEEEQAQRREEKLRRWRAEDDAQLNFMVRTLTLLGFILSILVLGAYWYVKNSHR